MTSFRPSTDLAALIERVRRLAAVRGIEGFVLGGTVRDALLGRDVRDLDITVEGDARVFSRLLADDLAGHFVGLDEERGVVRVVLPEPSPYYVDVAQFQGSIEQDLRRRDFTIDALAVRLGDDRVIDVTGGLDDLAARVVRMNSRAVLKADPLRPLRGGRIAAELGFMVEEATAAEIRRLASRVSEASPERRRDELVRIFRLDAAGTGVRLLDSLGLLDWLIPELAAGRGCEQPQQFHAFDVFEHNVRTLEALDAMLSREEADVSGAWLRDVFWRAFKRWEADLRETLTDETTPGVPRSVLLKLAALLHDVGKPATRSIDPDGRIRFFEHADEGARMAGAIMRRLRFSSREIELVKMLVAEHLRPVQLAPLGAAPTRRALYRFHCDAGEALPLVLILALADGAAAGGERVSPESWSRQAAYMNGLLVRLSEEEGIVRAPRLLTGRDIMQELSIREGPVVGQLLRELREAQAEGIVTDRAGAIAFVKSKTET